MPDETFRARHTRTQKATSWHAACQREMISDCVTIPISFHDAGCAARLINTGQSDEARLWQGMMSSEYTEQKETLHTRIGHLMNGTRLATTPTASSSPMRRLHWTANINSTTSSIPSQLYAHVSIPIDLYHSCTWLCDVGACQSVPNITRTLNIQNLLLFQCQNTYHKTHKEVVYRTNHLPSVRSYHSRHVAWEWVYQPICRRFGSVFSKQVAYEIVQDQKPDPRNE